MTRTLILAILTAALAATPSSAAVTFDWAYVGNAGNAPDPQTGYGAVAYDYAISKHEVTNAQYAEFLNAADPTGANTRALYNSYMANDYGGIELQAANADRAKYAIKAGRAHNPVNYVSFLDAMRFTNWLHNGQGAGDTENGVYTIGSGFDEVRSPGAKVWIPSESEWYKAAYHDASAGTAGVYFDYATGSDNTPVSDNPRDNRAAVNYYNNDGFADGPNDGYAVSGERNFPSRTDLLTDVGAYTEAASPYGTFDQNGNLWEWNEAVVISVNRGMRGGSWGDLSANLRADVRASVRATDESVIFGFRVATLVPEPSTLLMVSLLSAALLAPRRV